MRSTDIHIEWNDSRDRTENMYLPSQVPVEEMSLSEARRGLCARAMGSTAACRRGCGAACCNVPAMRRAACRARDKRTLTKTGYQLTGIHPRNFIISRNGRYLLVACRDSNSIQVFERDSQTGLLKDTGKTIKTNKPVCLKFTF